MKKTIQPSPSLKGTLSVPSDKSITHRAVLFSSLSKGQSVITDPLESADCLSSLSCVEALGCEVEKGKGEWTISSQGLRSLKAPSTALDCGNSGTTIRLLSGILAAQNFKSELKGDASLHRRPMERIAAPLNEMGANVALKDDHYPPIVIQGNHKLKPIRWDNPIASAQVKSCVLLAALHCEGESLYVEPSLSRDHTERMLAGLGVRVERSDNTIRISGASWLPSHHWVIPGDFSSAAFFLVASLLVSKADVTLKNVNLNPTRTGLLTVLKKMGAIIKVEEREEGGEPVGNLHVQQQADLQAASYDPTDLATLLDEIPILAVLATQAKGQTHLKGLSELRIKETDRVKAVATNLKKMGASIEEEKEGLVITGPTPLKGAELDSFGDHRIAMAFAVAGLIAQGDTTILNSDCVSISYPSFWDHLASLCRN